MQKTTILAVSLSLALHGCTPVLSNRIVQEADSSIAYADLQRQPERYRGAVVILGGQIVETVVKEGETRVQVLQLPLGAQQAPVITSASQGRFIVVYNRFVDPVIYGKGRKITVAGEVQGGSVLALGQGDFRVPVILERETYLWKAEDAPLHGTRPSLQFGIGIGVGR